MTDAFDRLKNRARPSVPARDASLVKRQNDQMSEFSHLIDSSLSEQQNHQTQNDELNELLHQEPVDLEPETEIKVISPKKTTSVPNRSAKQSPVPEIDDEDESPVVRRTLRIDETIDEDLERLCNKEKITREVFIEAAYQVSSENPKLMEKILKIAKDRYIKRKRTGERRKFLTLAKKLQADNLA